MSELQKQYRLVLSGALRALHSFRGTEAQQEDLLTKLIDAEKWAEAALPRLSPAARERQLIKPTASGFLAPDGKQLFKAKLPSLNEFLERASKRFMQLMSDSNDPSQVAKQLGIICNQSNQVFLPPDSMEPHFGIGGEDRYEVKYQPRLQWLIKGLQNIGVFSDDLIIHTGIVKNTQLRTVSYCLLEIPRLAAEVLVCNQVGEATFVITENRGSKYYLQTGKEALVVDEKVRKVTCFDKAQWLSEILETLSTKKLGPKVNLETLEKLRFIDQAVEEFRKIPGNEQRWPHSSTGKIMIAGAETSHKWVHVDSWFRGGKSPAEYKSLPDYLEKVHGKEKRLIMNLSELSLEFVDQALTYFRKIPGNEERWPSLYSGEILLEGKATQYSWQQVDHWFNGGRSPAEYKSMADYLEKVHGKEKRKFTDLSVLSIEFVEQAVTDFRKTPGNEEKWPNASLGKVVILGEETSFAWDQVDTWFRGSKSPAEYGSLLDYLEKMHGKEKRKDLSELSIEFVEQAVKEFRKTPGNEDKWPYDNPVEILLEGEATQYSWQQVDNWFMGGRSPAEYQSLADYLEKVHGKEKRKFTDLSELSIEFVEQAVTEFRKTSGNEERWPTIASLDKVVILGEETSYAWYQVNNWFMGGKSPAEYRSLPDYLEKVHGKEKRSLSELSIEFVEQAVTEFRKTPGNEERWPSQLSGTIMIAGEETLHKWNQVNAWFRGSKSPAEYTSLADFLDKVHRKEK